MDSREGRDAIRRIALLLEYDGTEYHGWQIQGVGNTVQQTIKDAIAILTREHVNLVASGRTDSGVHALGQVAHFDLASDIRLSRLCIALNGILPSSISIRNCFHVDDGFHARFDARTRRYRYRVYNHPYRSPFMRYRAMWIQKEVHIETWNEALSCLIGEHDFISFCKKMSADKGTVRYIELAFAEKRGSTVEVIIQGNAFLHNQIRIIMGTLAMMTEKDLGSGHMRDVLDARDRDAAGETAPPYGLYLDEVTYDPPLESYTSALDDRIK